MKVMNCQIAANHLIKYEEETSHVVNNQTVLNKIQVAVTFRFCGETTGGFSDLSGCSSSSIAE